MTFDFLGLSHEVQMNVLTRLDKDELITLEKAVPWLSKSIAPLLNDTCLVYNKNKAWKRPKNRYLGKAMVLEYRQITKSRPCFPIKHLVFCFFKKKQVMKTLYRMMETNHRFRTVRSIEFFPRVTKKEADELQELPKTKEWQDFHILEAINKIEEVDLTGTHLTQLKPIRKIFKGLKSLNLSGINPDLDFFNKCQQLTRLDFGENKEFDPQTLPSLPNLTHLTIQFPNPFNAESVGAPNAFLSLTYLDIKGPLSRKIHLECAPNLKTLVLERTELLSNVNEGLIELNVNGCRKIKILDDHGFPHLKILRAIYSGLQMSSFKSDLEILEITSRKEQDEFFERIKNLRALRFNNHFFIDPAKMNLDRLETLYMCDVDLANVNMSLPNLKDIVIKESRNLGDLPFLNDSTKLTYMTLYWDKLEDVSFVSRFPHLRVLDIGRNEITEFPDLSHLRDLEYLNVSDNEKLLFKDLDKKLPKLFEYLYMTVPLLKKDQTRWSKTAHRQFRCFPNRKEVLEFLEGFQLKESEKDVNVESKYIIPDSIFRCFGPRRYPNK